MNTASTVSYTHLAHDYIITADYKLLPATEAIGEDYESGLSLIHI